MIYLLKHSAPIAKLLLVSILSLYSQNKAAMLVFSLQLFITHATSILADFFNIGRLFQYWLTFFQYWLSLHSRIVWTENPVLVQYYCS